MAEVIANYEETRLLFPEDSLPVQAAKYPIPMLEEAARTRCRARPILDEEPFAAHAYALYLEFLQGPRPYVDPRSDVLYKEIKDLGDGVIEQMKADAFKPKK